MSERGSADDRAYRDALAGAAKGGVPSEDVSSYADSLRGTLWFDVRALRHALSDVRAVLMETPAGRLWLRTLGGVR